jgi:hypothetical protein
VSKAGAARAVPVGERSGQFLVWLLAVILSFRRGHDVDGGVAVVGAGDGVLELFDPLTEGAPGVGQSLGSQDEQCDFL